MGDIVRMEITNSLHTGNKTMTNEIQTPRPNTSNDTGCSRHQSSHREFYNGWEIMRQSTEKINGNADIVRGRARNRYQRAKISYKAYKLDWTTEQTLLGYKFAPILSGKKIADLKTQIDASN